MKTVNIEAKWLKIYQDLQEIGYTIRMAVPPNPKTQQYIGRKLREYREQKGITQQQVADSIDVHVSYYAGIERGEENPSISVVEALCKLFRVKASNILPF